MKITVCGKGGSGKSTITSLLAKEFAAKGKKVAVIDCDESNYGLHQQLAMEIPESLTDYLGGKMKIMGDLAGGPQNMPMLFESSWTLDDIPKECYSQKDGVMLMTPGKIQTVNEACACPFNAVMAQFMAILSLADNEVVIMDMEAGIEHFGRGTDNATDIVIMVVDPSKESLKLSTKISEMCSKLGKPIYYVLNKVDSDNAEIMRDGVDDKAKICCELPLDKEILKAGLLGDELNMENTAIKKMAEFLMADRNV